MAGPIIEPSTRETFMLADVSDTAPERSSARTSVGSVAEKVGPLTAWPREITNTVPSSARRFGSAASVTSASAMAAKAWNTEMPIRRRRRS